MDWIVFTTADNALVLGFNADTNYWVMPRQIDNPSHPRVGEWVAPERVTQGDYAPYWADRLAGYRRIVAEPEELFLPPPEDAA